MEFTKPEKKLLAEAEKYTFKAWHDTLGWIMLLLLSGSGIIGIIDRPIQS
jgi:uncharacterized membrane protein